MNSQILTINLVPGSSAPAVVRVSQYDVGRPILFKVMDGTMPASFVSGTVATVVGTKPSGLGFSEVAAISGNTASLNSTLAMTQEAGMIQAEVRFSIQNGPDIGTANFILAVEKTPHAEGTTDGTQETMTNLETRLQAEIDDLDDRVTALEEAEESGLTAQEKSLILTLFSKAAYAEDDAQTAYDTLEGLWRVVYRTITYNLTNCISTSSVTSVESNKPYSTSLATQTGYTITSVTVTMGGTDVTSSYYSSGQITIPSVTGDVVITAVATKSLNSITATYTQSGTVYDTDTLDSLKTDLVVTANYSDGTSETVTDYTLSGTLTEGTSVITVGYSGLTTTFSVIVSALLPSGYTKYDYVYNTVQGNGSAIDTGLGGQYCDMGYKHELTFMYTTEARTASDALYGLRATTGSDPKARALWAKRPTSQSQLAANYGGTDTGFVFDFSIDTKYKSITANGQWTMNDVTVRNNMDTGSYVYPTSGTIQLLGICTGGSSGIISNVVVGTRIYGFKITNISSGEVVAEFIPCTNASNVAGLYDAVNHSFHQGSTASNIQAGND